MRTEEVKKAGVEASKRPPPGHSPGEVLHQRRNLPISPYTMALGGFLFAATIGYLTLYAKKKPEASAVDVAKVATGTAQPEDTRPSK
ncbi:uncharacterized protein LOC132302397 [Cornus florida]|uniref:uncharacterized protein LOC132302397 n=1 Tax=Cornus florida TaxID=4283 RepID=UPI00289A8494|nr:uncharacterized protein LOC132302397 [Cornus florida]